jgi:glutathione S-transferase
MKSKAEYTLYYWSVPFRGQFIRAILSYANKTYEEPDDKAIADLMDLVPGKQPYPFMGPPLLVDDEDGSTLAQMPAIAFCGGQIERSLRSVAK